MLDRPASEIVSAIHNAVTAFTQGAPAADDITLVVARRHKRPHHQAISERRPLRGKENKWWAHQDSNLGPTDYEFWQAR